jgi:hypothetical protein
MWRSRAPHSGKGNPAVQGGVRSHPPAEIVTELTAVTRAAGTTKTAFGSVQG